MIYLSAGHHNADPGASGNGKREADLTKIQRDLTSKELDKLKVKHTKDDDRETLSEYLKRIQTTSTDVVLEYHFNAFNTKATGVETIVSDSASATSKAFAKELNDVTAKILKIFNRGVKSEKDSHRGKLGLMRENGCVALMELCFIDNKADLASWELNKALLAVEHAKIIKKYEDLS